MTRKEREIRNKKIYDLYKQGGKNSNVAILSSKFNLSEATIWSILDSQRKEYLSRLATGVDDE